MDKADAPVASPAAEEKDKDAEPAKFSPEEEAELVAESHAQKTAANALFASASYEAALTKYEEAVAVCPNYLDYELAVLRSNIAACHLKLEAWKEAISAASAALEGLDRVEKQSAAAAAAESTGSDDKIADTDASQATNPPASKPDDDEVDEEIVSSGAAKAAIAPAPSPDLAPEETSADKARRQRTADIARIRAKALMRRGRARSELGGWAVLEAALEDYAKLAGMDNLGAADRRMVQSQLRSLPARAKTAQETETAEMWGKLKELGNGILKPFGLSTENFKMTKDAATGGYSMNFEGGGGK